MLIGGMRLSVSMCDWICVCVRCIRVCNRVRMVLVKKQAKHKKQAQKSHANRGRNRKETKRKRKSVEQRSNPNTIPKSIPAIVCNQFKIGSNKSRAGKHTIILDGFDNRRRVHGMNYENKINYKQM